MRTAPRPSRGCRSQLWLGGGDVPQHRDQKADSYGDKVVDAGDRARGAGKQDACQGGAVVGFVVPFALAGFLIVVWQEPVGVDEEVAYYFMGALRE
ncbi:hypothetical protein R8Z50_21945 [Longispora sp. K20-0274]|uniref:hypothetical protein n=1 Tax=Longispora sp. K20-0274 TaxID=3088255 RepID=UPI00399A811E